MAKDNYLAIYYHLVFSTKERTPYLTKEIGSTLHAYIIGCSDPSSVVIIRVNGMTDHIHLLIGVTTGDFTLSNYIRELKKTTNKLLNTQLGFNGRFAWQNGYFACSVSAKDVEGVKRYIEMQKSHHASMSLENELALIVDRTNL